MYLALLKGDGSLKNVLNIVPDFSEFTWETKYTNVKWNIKYLLD